MGKCLVWITPISDTVKLNAQKFLASIGLARIVRAQENKKLAENQNNNNDHYAVFVVLVAISMIFLFQLLEFIGIFELNIIIPAFRRS